ncbi:GDP-L-fucose synthase family protein [Salegentibacter sediminis]|uniref:GDP-L-fucose synthase family protein n=1 Tax=Salegentibacter sediminis TaxID=1930251 RepID=UPI0009C15705|nr:GDP-L-fucose synthase [Salegentibacter sediminis]
MEKDTRIYIAGHRGMVGSAIWRKLEAEGFTNLIDRTSRELDLRHQESVEAFFEQEEPDVVIAAAARVGGILANRDHPYEFLVENLQIQNNLIEASHRLEVQKFIYLGSSCIYPKLAPQPIKEEYLLTGPLEPTNETYAIAKIAGLKACEAIRKQYGKDFISLMPTNLYGYNDNFDLESSHVLPALLRKFHEAKINGNEPVEVWGSGSPLREFLYADDLADAVHFVLEHKLPESYYNVGTGREISIKELALLIQEIVRHRGEIRWDKTKPDGTPRKLLDVSKLKAEGWEASTSLEEGIRNTYTWYCKQL